jgi:hypothetical protein
LIAITRLGVVAFPDNVGEDFGVNQRVSHPRGVDEGSLTDMTARLPSETSENRGRWPAGADKRKKRTVGGPTPRSFIMCLAARRRMS